MPKVNKIKTTVEEKTAEDKNENILRPKSLEQYIGQSNNKEMLKTSIRSAKKRNESLSHILLYGPPGLGKTTLAYILANEMECNLKYVAGPSIEKPGDVVALLNGLNNNDILFIDEIHRMNRAAEEVLYSAMEDFFITITIGEGEQQKQMKLSLPKFTLIGATTRAGMLSQPLRDRFGITCKMEFYTNDELTQIVNRTSSIMNFIIDETGQEIVARCSRGTPRIANRIVARINDYVIANDIEENEIVFSTVIDALKVYRINVNGLDETDIKLLNILNEHNGPIGLDTLSCIIGEDPETIESVYEPYLLKSNYIEKTPRGRVITPTGKQMIGVLEIE